MRQGLRMAAAVTFLLAGGFSAYAETTAAGVWETVDDKTGKVRSTVTLLESGGVFVGHVASIISRPGEQLNPLCEKCQGAKHRQPIKGLQIIEGMTRDGLNYSGGTILDPETGSVYDATMTLAADGNHLTVRGYVGISAFGRSQTWVRMK
ncbi:MAG: DUF2147 domain-containing protein [Ancalomicrobiaceae bacterium]|nr:DUF2147 domain-containing protein [Ancalomicrobiaceae bacterium]